MRCILSQFQLFAGRGLPVLEFPEPQPTRKPKKRIAYIPLASFREWMAASIRNYLAVIGGKVTIKDVWHPRLVRANDIILMDQFLTEHSLTEYQKAKLNYVCLWLRVITLADITDPTGLYIEAWARTGSKRLQSNLAWPRQE